MAIGERARVSVITPFYNAEAYIAETIEAVLQQSFEDYEYILVDDGSNDNGPDIVKSYMPKFSGRMRLIWHAGGVNRGLPASRNLGCSEALGRFIAPLDADDVWFPDKLAIQVSLAEQYPEVALVCGSAIYWGSWNGGTDCLVKTGHVQDSVIPPLEAALHVYPLGSKTAPCPSDWLLRKDAIDKIGGWDESFSGPRALFEDQALLTKLYVNFPVYFSSQVSVKYRLHAQSLMASVESSGQSSRVALFFFDWLVRFYRECRPAQKALLRIAKKRRSQMRRACLLQPIRRAVRWPARSDANGSSPAS